MFLSKLQIIEVADFLSFRMHVNGEIDHDFWLKDHGDPMFFFFFCMNSVHVHGRASC